MHFFISKRYFFFILPLFARELERIPLTFNTTVQKGSLYGAMYDFILFSIFLYVIPNIVLTY